MNTKLTLETNQDLEDLIRGVMVYATGGGGSPQKGLDFLKETLKETKKFELLNPNDLADDDYVCSCFYMGTIAPDSPERKEILKARGLTKKIHKRVLPQVVTTLEELEGKKIKAIVAIELGGQNTATPMDTAARKGIYIVDGDLCGRAVPELIQCTASINNINPMPLVSMDDFGNTVIIKNVVNDFCAEYLGKQITTLPMELVGQANYLMTGKELKKIVIPGTLSKCLNVGAAIRTSRESGKNPIDAILEETEGYLLFKGTIIDKKWKDDQGYLWGDTFIEGLDEFRNKEMKIWFKNENHIAWIDNKVRATSPDLITIVELKTGEGTTNTTLEKEQEVAVIGMPNKYFRTQNALETLEPRHFGFDIDYKTIEELNKAF